MLQQSKLLRAFEKIDLVDHLQKRVEILNSHAVAAYLSIF